MNNFWILHFRFISNLSTFGFCINLFQIYYCSTIFMNNFWILHFTFISNLPCTHLFQIYHSSVPFPLVSLEPVYEDLMGKGKAISSEQLHLITIKCFAYIAIAIAFIKKIHEKRFNLMHEFYRNKSDKDNLFKGGSNGKRESYFI